MAEHYRNYGGGCPFGEKDKYLKKSEVINSEGGGDVSGILAAWP